MASNADLVISLSADVAQFRQDMQQAAHGVTQVGESVQRMTGFVHTARLALESLVGAYLLHQMASIIRSTTEMGDEIVHTAQKTGLSIRSYQELAYAAQQVGIEHDRFAKSMDFFVKNIGLVAVGATTPAAKAFEQLGINVKTAGNEIKPTVDIVHEILTKIAGVESPAQRAAIAIQFFGRQGVLMVPFLQQGQEGIAALIKEAEKLGQLIPAIDVYKLDQAKHSIDVLRQAIKVGLAEAVSSVSPEITLFGRHIAEIVGSHDKDISSWAQQSNAGLTLLQGTIKLFDYSLQGLGMTLHWLSARFQDAQTAYRAFRAGLQEAFGAEPTHAKVRELFERTVGKSVPLPPKGTPEPTEEPPTTPQPEFGPYVGKKGAAETALEQVQKTIETINLETSAYERLGSAASKYNQVAQAMAKLDQEHVLNTQAGTAAIQALTTAVERNTVVRGLAKVEDELNKAKDHLAVVAATPAKYEELARQEAIHNGLIEAGIPLTQMSNVEVQKLAAAYGNLFETLEKAKYAQTDKSLVLQTQALHDEETALRTNLGVTVAERDARQTVADTLEIDRVLREANLIGISEEGRLRTSLTRQIQEQRNALDDVREGQELIKNLYESSLNPARRYAEVVAEIDDAEKHGVATADKLAAARQEAFRQFVEMEPEWKRQQDLIEGVGNSFSDFFENAISGSKSLSESLLSLGESITKVLRQELIEEPFKEAIRAWARGGTAAPGGGGTPASGGGGVVGGIFGTLLGWLGLGGGGGSPAATAAGVPNTISNATINAPGATINTGGSIFGGGGAGGLGGAAEILGGPEAAAYGKILETAGIPKEMLGIFDSAQVKEALTNSVGTAFTNNTTTIGGVLGHGLTSVLSILFGSSGGGISSGIGNIFSGVLGAVGKLFGFAKGGEFDVPGASGPDTHLVQFWATPGEKVTITPPGEKSATERLEEAQGSKQHRKFQQGGSFTVGDDESYGGLLGGPDSELRARSNTYNYPWWSEKPMDRIRIGQRDYTYEQVSNSLIQLLGVGELKFLGGTAGEKKAITSAFELLPDNVQEFLSGLKVKIADKITGAGIKPGTATGVTTLAEDPYVTYGRIHQLADAGQPMIPEVNVMSQKEFGRRFGLEKVGREAAQQNVFLHETGHAFDIKTGMKASGGEFAEAYERDVENWVQQASRSPGQHAIYPQSRSEEMFAELFAARTGGSGDVWQSRYATTPYLDISERSPEAYGLVNPSRMTSLIEESKPLLKKAEGLGKYQWAGEGGVSEGASDILSKAGRDFRDTLAWARGDHRITPEMLGAEKTEKSLQELAAEEMFHERVGSGMRVVRKPIYSEGYVETLERMTERNAAEDASLAEAKGQMERAAAARAAAQRSTVGSAPVRAAVKSVEPPPVPDVFSEVGPDVIEKAVAKTKTGAGALVAGVTGSGIAESFQDSKVREKIAEDFTQAFVDPKLKEQIKINFGEGFSYSRPQVSGLLSSTLAESFASPNVKEQNALNFSDAFESAQPQVESIFGEVFSQGASLLKDALLGGGGKGEGGNGILSGLLDLGLDWGGKLLGLQAGGEFKVAGSGGPDSSLVAFRATPGERVSVDAAETTKRPGMERVSTEPPEASRIIHPPSITAMTRPEPTMVQPVVNIINQHPGASIEARRSRTGRDLEIIVSEVLSRDIHHNGPLARALQQTHGISRVGVGR